MAGFTQLSRAYCSSEISSDKVSILFFSDRHKLIHLPTSLSLAKKVEEILREGGGDVPKTAELLAEMMTSKNYIAFVNKNGLLGDEVIEVSRKQQDSDYHLVLERGFPGFIQREEIGVFNYLSKLSKGDYHHEIIDWNTRDGMSNPDKLRKSIEDCRIDSLGGRAYNGCAFVENLSSTLISNFGLNPHDVAKVQKFYTNTCVTYDLPILGPGFAS